MNQKLSWPISRFLKFFNSEWRKQIESSLQGDSSFSHDSTVLFYYEINDM